MGGMRSAGILSTNVSRPSEFITSISKFQGGNANTTQLPPSFRNTLRETKPCLKFEFQPSYSYESKTWREEITFKNAASAKAHYSQGWGQILFTTPIKRKIEEIETPYSFSSADGEHSTESDPDERDQEVVSASFIFD
jgi:hypothetical protein